jgi:hypothetical protein
MTPPVLSALLARFLQSASRFERKVLQAVNEVRVVAHLRHRNSAEGVERIFASSISRRHACHGSRIIREVMYYLSHAWAAGRRCCHIYVRLHDGKAPSFGEMLLVDVEGGEPMLLTIQDARWQDEERGGVLVLAALPDQAAVIDRLTAGVSTRRQ